MPAATMPQASEPGRDDAGGSIPTAMRTSGGAAATRGVLDRGTRPQRVRPVLDDLAVDLLAPQPRARVTGHDFVEERRRQERRIGLRRCARHGRARIGDQPLDEWDRPRRRGDELARPAADPQAELQHVERRFRMAPFGEFVAPRGIELRAAQRFRILGREGLCHRAVRPFQPAPRRNPGGPLRARRNLQDSGDAFDHHLADIVLALADQRDMAVAALGIGRRAMRRGVDPLGAEPCLAGAAPAQHQPGGPRLAIGSPAVVGGLRRVLVRMRQRREVTARPQRLHERPLARPCLLQSGFAQKAVCVAQVRDGIHRCLGACRHRPIRYPGADRCAGGPAHAGSASVSPACARSVPHRREGAAASQVICARLPRRRVRARPAARCVRSSCNSGGALPPPKGGGLGWGSHVRAIVDPHPPAFGGRPPPFRGR